MTRDEFLELSAYCLEHFDTSLLAMAHRQVADVMKYTNSCTIPRAFEVKFVDILRQKPFNLLEDAPARLPDVPTITAGQVLLRYAWITQHALNVYGTVVRDLELAVSTGARCPKHPLLYIVENRNG